MKVNLNRSALGATSKSLTRLPSHRSMQSQKSLENLEKGWSTKFKLAHALEEKPIVPLHRPISPARNDVKIVNGSIL